MICFGRGFCFWVCLSFDKLRMIYQAQDDLLVMGCGGGGYLG